MEIEDLIQILKKIQLINPDTIVLINGNDKFKSISNPVLGNWSNKEFNDMDNILSNPIFFDKEKYLQNAICFFY